MWEAARSTGSDYSPNPRKREYSTILWSMTSPQIRSRVYETVISICTTCAISSSQRGESEVYGQDSDLRCAGSDAADGRSRSSGKKLSLQAVVQRKRPDGVEACRPGRDDRRRWAAPHARRHGLAVLDGRQDE